MDLADRILTLIGVAAASALVAPRPLRRALDGGLKLAGWFGRAPRLWVSMVGVVGFIAPFLGAHYVRWPVPSIHDEFAYLLTAETFASGRAAMPTHPFWEHFETYHVIHQPTYAAKYPPGLALPFALGEALFDEPRYGLWLQGGALAAAVAWMLFGWLSPRLAVIGSLLAIGRYTLAGPWVQTFYNGALAGIGGALALGALGRLLRRPADPRMGSGIALGVGFGLLAGTRPFEGLVLAVPCAVALLAWLGRRLRTGQGRATLRVFAPAAVVVFTAIGGILLYNRAVTGDPLRLPYTEYDRQYSVYPPFLWQAKAPEPQFRHDVLREFALGFQAGDYGAWGDARQMAWLVGERGYELARDFAGWPLFLLCAAYLLRPRGKGVRFLAIVGVCAFAALCTTTYIEPRYAAPVVSAMVAVATVGLDNLRRAGLRRRGPAFGVAALAVVLGTGALTWNDFHTPPISWFGRMRADVVAGIVRHPGEHIVFVRVAPGHSPHHIWVTNGADIDGQRVIWARDLGTERNAALAARYPERTVWTLTSGDLLVDGPELQRGLPPAAR